MYNVYVYIQNQQDDYSMFFKARFWISLAKHWVASALGGCDSMPEQPGSRLRFHHRRGCWSEVPSTWNGLCMDKPIQLQMFHDFSMNDPLTLVVNQQKLISRAPGWVCDKRGWIGWSCWVTGLPVVSAGIYHTSLWIYRISKVMSDVFNWCLYPLVVFLLVGRQGKSLSSWWQVQHIPGWNPRNPTLYRPDYKGASFSYYY